MSRSTRSAAIEPPQSRRPPPFLRHQFTAVVREVGECGVQARLHCEAPAFPVRPGGF
jgi:hypothetical protein